MSEAWRRRRTAYASGRKEVIGYENPVKRKKRKVKKKTRSVLAFTPMRSKHRWKKQ